MCAPLNQVSFASPICHGNFGEVRVFHVCSALAQFERRLIQERTHAGLAVARAHGKKGGRTPRRAEEPRVRMAYTMYVDQRLTVRDICRVLRISQATFYRYVALGRRAAETT